MHKVRSIITLFIFVFLFVPSLGWSATYYVDYSSGRDSNPGTSYLPWKRCPGMNGWSGNATLSAGDIVYFANTDTWTVESGSYLLSVVGGVTYDGSRWGSGTRAKFIATGSLAYRATVIDFQKDDARQPTVVKGFHIDVNNRSASGISINRSSSKDLTGATKRIDNCVVHDINSAAETGYFGIIVSAANNNDTANVEVLNCLVYNTPWAAVVAYEQYGGTTRSQIRNITIRGCEIYNSGQSTSQPTVGGFDIMIKNDVLNAIVEHNYVHDAGNFGICIENDPNTPSPHNIIVRHNIVSYNGKGGIYIAQTGNKSVDIYSNLIFKNNNTTSSNGAGIYFESNLGGDISARLLNNTLFQNANGEIRIASSSARYINLEIKNNIMYSRVDKYPLYASVGGKITSHSNNIYYRPNSGNVVKDGGSYYDLTNLNAWESNAFNIDPMLKNVSNLPSGFIGTYENDIRPNYDGLDIKEDSPARGYGVVMGSSYDGSINSVNRSADSGWDIGAYEHISGQSLYAPTNLKVIALQ